MTRAESIRALVETAPLEMQQWREEIVPFLEWWDARTPPENRRVVEIGTGSGGLTAIWAQLASLVISVDLPPTEFTHTIVKERDEILQVIAEACGGMYMPIYGRSQSLATVTRVQDVLEDQPIDLLFLDGDHSLEGLRRDWLAYRPLVRSGGIVAFHDLNSHSWPSVAQVWDEVHCAGIDSKVFTIHGSWGGIGAVIV